MASGAIPSFDLATLRAAAPGSRRCHEPYASIPASERDAGARWARERPAVDGSLLFWYGPRIARLHELADALATALRAQP